MPQFRGTQLDENSHSLIGGILRLQGGDDETKSVRQTFQ